MKKLLFAIAVVTAWGIAGASAQNYPARPITMIAPFPAGGSTDIVARILADGLKAPLGQTVVVENISGASGTIGSGRVARAEPDGYTLLLGQWSSNVGAGALYPLPYHVLNDFEPIAMVTTSARFGTAATDSCLTFAMYASSESRGTPRASRPPRGAT